MLAAIKIPKTLGAFERGLAACVLFFGAEAFCLPVEVVEGVIFPWWATKSAIGNVLLHELLFLVWIAIYGTRFVLPPLVNGGIPTRQAALWLIALALWCGLISLTAPLLLQDLGRTARLLCYAALLFAVVRWTRRTGNVPLEILILGFLTGTIINLVISFQYPFVMYGTMRLSGQNTPGVAMGIAIHLSAWVFYRTGSHTIRSFAVIATIVFIYGCGISYSRIGWFTGALGLMAWAYILIVAMPRERKEKLRLKRTRWVWVPLLALSLPALLNAPIAVESLELIQTLAKQKLSGTEGGGDIARLSYVEGVAEILLKYPFGVGYSGFFDAITATAEYRSDRANEEESLDANPHATFLWYASAGGIPGGVLSIAVFVMLLNSMRFGLRSAMGRPGLVLFAFVALPYFVIGLTVPYLFNSIILIVPTAIAAGWGWAQRVELSERTSSGPTHKTAALRGTELNPARNLRSS